MLELMMHDLRDNNRNALLAFSLRDQKISKPLIEYFLRKMLAGEPITLDMEKAQRPEVTDLDETLRTNTRRDLIYNVMHYGIKDIDETKNNLQRDI